MEHTQPALVETAKSELSILKPFEKQKEELQALVDEYKNLVVTKETYENAKKVLALFRGIRVETDKTLKYNKSILNSAKSEQEKKAAELIAITTPLEDTLYAGVKAIDDEKEIEKKRKEEEAMKKIALRTASLSAYEMKYDDGSYTLGDHTITPVQLKVFTDEEFASFLEDVKMEYNNIIELRNEAARLKKVEEERLEEQRKEQEKERLRLQEIADQQQAQADLLRKQQEEFQAEQDRVKRENEEKERIRLDAIAKQQEYIRKQQEEVLNAVRKQRSMQLENMGVWFDRETESFCLIDSEAIVTLVEVVSADTEAWESLIKKITPLVKKYNEEQQQKRLDDLKAEQDRKDAELKVIEDRKKALQPDREKLSRLFDQFTTIEFPECKDPSAIEVCNEVARRNDETKKYLAGVLNSL